MQRQKLSPFQSNLHGCVIINSVNQERFHKYLNRKKGYDWVLSFVIKTNTWIQYSELALHSLLTRYSSLENWQWVHHYCFFFLVLCFLGRFVHPMTPFTTVSSSLLQLAVIDIHYPIQELYSWSSSFPSILPSIVALEGSPLSLYGPTRVAI